jgi:dephospho-CoA kinase
MKNKMRYLFALLLLTSVCQADVVNTLVTNRKAALQAIIVKANQDIADYQAQIDRLEAVRDLAISEAAEFDKVKKITIEAVAKEEPIIDEGVYP